MTSSRQRILITGLILFGIVIVGFFGWRTFHAFKEFRGHRPPPFPAEGAASPETDVELIRDWMTIGFLSKTYRTPPDLLYKALGIRPNGNEHKSLKQLNDEYFPENPGYVLKTVKAEIQSWLPPPTEISPPTKIPPSTENPPVSP
jgi:hypothetical protein